MSPRRSTARERRLTAIHEGDKTFWITFGPVLASIADAVGGIWCLGIVYSLAVGRAAAEAQIPLMVAAIPVLLFWLVGRAVRRMAHRIRDERADDPKRQ
jgi:hypothetical protein